MSDSMGTCGPDLQAMYESLRSHATGQAQSVSLPQGLALLRRSGVPVWMAAWAHVALTATRQLTPVAGNSASCALAGSNRDVVMVLAEMVLGGRRKE